MSSGASDAAAHRAKPLHEQVHRTALAGLRVLILEDQASQRRVLARRLAAAGASVQSFSCIADAEQPRAHLLSDVWIVDQHLPDGNGFAAVGRWQRSKRASVVAMTGYQAAAADLLRMQCENVVFLTKPFTFDEMCIAVALARSRITGDDSPRPVEVRNVIGDFLLDPIKGTLTRGDLVLRLSHGEQAMLTCLAASRHECLMSKELARRVLMRTDHAASHLAVQYVSRLRRLLRGHGVWPGALHKRKPGLDNRDDPWRFCAIQRNGCARATGRPSFYCRRHQL
jgi:DNA-binding response OmpR family regulator